MPSPTKFRLLLAHKSMTLLFEFSGSLKPKTKRRIKRSLFWTGKALFLVLVALAGPHLH